jgi:hypothetical protein
MNVLSSRAIPAGVRGSRLHLSLFNFAILICGAAHAGAQVKMPRGYPGPPPWADTARESNVYPVGDAVGVYTAVLDLYFIDGAERPTIIVMHDTAEGRSGGPCPMQCPEAWLHKSKIDESTMLAYAKLSPKRPKMIPFGYPIPITYLSWEQANQLREQGRQRLEAQRRVHNILGEDWVEAFTHRFPGAWGFITLSKVGFNGAHTEALVHVHFLCGVSCASDEILFLRKIGSRWTVIERIPNDAEGLQPADGMRYRGSYGSNPGESEVLFPPKSQRAEGADAIAIYETVLDSLYNFHGEFPRRIVVTDWYPVDFETPAHSRPIQQSTLTRYKFFRGVRAPLNSKLQLRAPVTVLPRDSMPEVEKVGKPLEKMVLQRQLMMETSPFWLGFRQQYPGAWGMVGFTRAAFNDDRTEALVFTSHSCGTTCRNDDTWLLERSNGKWEIVERIPRTSDRDVELDSLRYLGADANPRSYRPRRVRGAFVTKPTGTPLAHLLFTVHMNQDSSFKRTDDGGRYEITNLPLMGGVTITVPCQGQPMLAGAATEYSSRPLQVAQFPSYGGIDSSANIPVDLRRCLLHRRAQPLIGAKPAPQALASGYPDVTDAAVYRAVFDELYPDRRRPVLVFPYVHRLWDYDFNSELFRLTKQGVVDPTMSQRLGMLPKDSAWLRPSVRYGRRVIVLGRAERDFLEEQAAEFGETGEKRDLSLTAMAREAYPGAGSILSLSRIAYNQKLDQAIVQVAAGSLEPWNAGETMILYRQGSTWRVVRRHVDKEATSGNMVAGRCEPVDATKTVPTLNQLERFVGDAEITIIPTAPDLRGHADTAHYRFIPTDTLHRYYWVPPKGDTRPPTRLKGGQKLAVALAINDSTGKPREHWRGALNFSPYGATLAFFDDPIVLDGAFEEFTILRVDGRQFFGTWSTGSGPTYPFKGYFCGRLR